MAAGKMRIKVARNIGRDFKLPDGTGVPQWRENQVVDADKETGEALIGLKLAEDAKDEDLTPEETVHRLEKMPGTPVAEDGGVPQPPGAAVVLPPGMLMPGVTPDHARAGQTGGSRAAHKEKAKE
jgi:hypothetical protein